MVPISGTSGSGASGSAASGSFKRNSSWPGTVAPIALLLACLAVSLLVSFAMREGDPGRMVMVDFGGVYYGARCALRHVDPYDPPAVLHEFQAEGGRFLSDPTAAKSSRFAVTWDVYLPSALFVLIPLAVLPWSVAQTLWISITALLLVLSAICMIELGGRAGLLISCCLGGFLLGNCELLFKVGNVAGVAVGLCAIAAWCFLRHRFELLGVALLAVSLLLKPHDTGFVWLFFLLTGATTRRRALQTMAVTAVLGVCAAIWIAHSSPDWPRELHNNLAAVSLPGGTSDPGPSGMTARGIVPIISLQSAISLFWNNPHFYNPVSYLVGGVLILIWILAVLRKRPSPQGALLAIAAVSVLTILPLYHRTYDAKLLLLTVPACAVLWSSKAAGRWIAVALTSAAFFVSGDIPITFMLKLGEGLPLCASTLRTKLVELAVLRPAPVFLLALGCFYLWMFVRYEPVNEGPQSETALPRVPVESATT